MTLFKVFICAALLSVALTVFAQTNTPAVPTNVPMVSNNISSASYNSRGIIPGDAANGIKGLNDIYRYINVYRTIHNGQFPPQTADLLGDIAQHMKTYGFTNLGTALDTFWNPDTQYSDDRAERIDPHSNIPYFISGLNFDGSPVGSPKMPGVYSALSWLNIYFHLNAYTSKEGRPLLNPVGYYLVLWDNGQTQKIPYDEMLKSPVQGAFQTVFPQQIGIPVNSVTYGEYWTQVARLSIVPLGKPVPIGRDDPILDNGAPEALITFSRLFSYHNRYGIDREEMWKVFDPAQAEYSLQNVQSGAAKLDLSLQLRKLTLDELQKLNAPAIFMTSDDKRIVTLSSLDDKEAIIIDRGLTRIVSREVLAKRYSGEALLPQIAEVASSIVADDPIRIITLQDTTEEIAQEVKITNRGAQPLTLQIERPIPGVTQAELSADTVAPGQTATLSLKLKWRSVLKGETQNVFVFLRTNDPVRPRLPLGFQLRTPQAKQP